MRTISSLITVTQVIQKSEFICLLAPVTSVDEAKEILALTRKKHFNATHNCYAYILGENEDIVKYSDDGEPSQTAGIVIYDVLKKNNLTNIIAIVTRYFGGIKLGAGGLVRAYSSSVALALKDIEFKTLTDGFVISSVFDYQYLTLIQNALKSLISYEYDLNISYLDKVSISCWLKSDDVKPILDRIESITKNTAISSVLEEKTKLL